MEGKLLPDPESGTSYLPADPPACAARFAEIFRDVDFLLAFAGLRALARLTVLNSPRRYFFRSAFSARAERPRAIVLRDGDVADGETDSTVCRAARTVHIQTFPALYRFVGEMHYVCRSSGGCCRRCSTRPRDHAAWIVGRDLIDCLATELGVHVADSTSAGCEDDIPSHRRNPAADWKIDVYSAIGGARLV